jgi:hypothetical protein
MTKRNMTLKSSLLVMLLIIICIGLGIAKAQMMAVTALNLNTASVNSTVHLGGLDLLRKHEPLLEDVKNNVVLKDAALHVDADGKSGALQNLLDA